MPRRRERADYPGYYSAREAAERLRAAQAGITGGHLESVRVPVMRPPEFVTDPQVPTAETSSYESWAQLMRNTDWGSFRIQHTRPVIPRTDAASALSGLVDSVQSMESETRRTTDIFRELYRQTTREGLGSNQSQTTTTKEVSVSHKENIQSLINDYASQNYTGGVTEALLNAKSSEQLGKDARKIAKAYNAWIATMGLRERANYDAYARATKSAEGVFAIETVRSSNAYIYGLTDSYMSVKEAITELAKVGPAWVVWVKRGTTLEATTGKGALHTEVMNRYLYNMDIRRSDGMVRTSTVVDGIDNVERLAKNYKPELLKLMRQRSKAAEEASRVEKAKPVRSGGGNFATFFASLMEKKVQTEDKLVERFAIAPHGLRSSRNWGIEVETGGARGVHKPAGWDARYDGSLRSAYTGVDAPIYADCAAEANGNHREYMIDGDGDEVYDENDNVVMNPDFVNAYDCTVCTSNRRLRDEYNRASRAARDAGGAREEDTREFVSPILHSFHSQGLEKLVKEIATQPQNNTSGVHVHVDVNDLTPRQIGSLTYGYSVIEHLLVSSYQRTTRQYCGARDTRSLQAVLASSKTARQKTNMSYGNRYLSLNLNSMSNHGTVEFRAMGPVYDYEYLIKWAYMARELVNVAKANIKQSEWNAVDSFEALHKLFVKYGQETVDESMSTITDSDIESIYERNVNGFHPRMSELVLVGGEI